MINLFIFVLVGADIRGNEVHAWSYAGQYANAGCATAAAKELGLTENWYKLVNTGFSS